MLRTPGFLGLIASLVSSYTSGCSYPVEPMGTGERGRSGMCPGDEECSDETPYGLDFMGTQVVGPYGYEGLPLATAVGGTQEITISRPDDYTNAAFTLPFVADDGGGERVEVTDQRGGVVSVRGTSPGDNMLRILSEETGLLFDRYVLRAAAITDAEVVTDGSESFPADMEIVWAAARPQLFGVALFGDVLNGGATQRERLVDTSMTIQLGGTAPSTWDATSGQLTAGMHSLTATTGDGVARTLSLEAVASVDDIMMSPNQSSLTLQSGYAKGLCFMATNQGRYVHGLQWDFTLRGTANAELRPRDRNNCAVFAAEGRPGQTVELVASAGGLSITVTVEIVRVDSNSARETLEMAGDISRRANRLPAHGQRALMVDN